MPLKTRKPITPGQRGLVLQTTDDITERKPKKSLVRPIKKTGGRNSTGRLTVRHRGGGHKRRYRVIDFKRDNFGISGIVETVEYDPNRSSRIALIKFQNGLDRIQLDISYDIDTHLTPNYNPWDQRLCLVSNRSPFGTRHKR